MQFWLEVAGLCNEKIKKAIPATAFFIVAVKLMTIHETDLCRHFTLYKRGAEAAKLLLHLYV